VPWCQECDRFVTPTSLGDGGACPRCGNAVDADVAGADAPGSDAAGAEEDVTVPWHFKLLLVATVLYLGWRAVQGVAWVVAHA
jgi:hypothetical protein